MGGQSGFSREQKVIRRPRRHGRAIVLENRRDEADFGGSAILSRAGIAVAVGMPMNTAVSDAGGVPKESRNKPGGSNHHEWATRASLLYVSPIFSSLLFSSLHLFTSSPIFSFPLFSSFGLSV